jgi:hypothetical protein
LFLPCLSFQHFDVFKGFRQRLPGLGGAGEKNREGEAALRAARHEEVGPEGDVPVQPVQDQNPGRKGKSPHYFFRYYVSTLKVRWSNRQLPTQSVGRTVDSQKRVAH